MRGTLGNPDLLCGQWHRLRGLLALALLGMLGACRPPAASPTPPGGDETYTLDAAQFEAAVSPVLVAEGCNNAQCHGGGPRGSFELSPPDAPDLDFDFDQASLQVWGWEPLQSPLLLKPLSQDAGGVDHAGAIGGAGFESTTDPDYLVIRDWILAGEYQ